jgi:hypothetical protein
MGSLAMGKIKIGDADGIFPNSANIESHNFSSDSSNPDVIGAFQGCASLDEVVLGKTVTDMQTVTVNVNGSPQNVSNAFSDCINLQSLVITNTANVIQLHSNGDLG